MSKALPLDLLIDVTSQGVRDTFTLGKLPTILIEKSNPNIPNAEFTEILRGIPDGAGIAKSTFGNTSNVAKFAEIYFGVTAKGASKADRLWVYNWAEAGQAEALKGAKIDATIFTLNGDFGIDLNGTVENFTINLVGALSFTEVASIIEAEIRTSSNPALVTATFTYSSTTGGFILSLSQLGEFNVKFVTGTSSDIHNRLGMSSTEGAVFIPNIVAKTFDEALSTIGAYNGSFYCITPNFQLTINSEIDELDQFGKFINASNDRFMGVYSWKNAQLMVMSSGATEKYEGYNGLLIDCQLNDFQNGFICGLIASINLSLVAGNENLAFQDNTIFQINAIVDAEKYQGLQDNKANAPAKFGILGQDDTIYQTGTILGTKTNNANIYLGNSFLKFLIQISSYNMFKSQKLISLRGKNGFGIISSYLNEAFESAVNSNIIVTGAELTTTETNVIISNFPDNAELAIESLRKNGYYYQVNRIDTVTKEMYITQAYMANMSVSKMIFNNYILGA